MHARVITIAGRPHYRWPDGLTLPVISGGDGPTDPPPDPTPPPAPTPDPAKTFTQDDVNRIVAEQKRQLLADQPDLTELRRKAKAFDDLEAENQTELERERDARARAEAERDAANERANTTAVRAAVVAAASRAGAVDADAVAALLPPGAVTLDDAGNVTGADDAVKALLDEKKYLAGTPAPQPDPDATPPTPTPGGADGGPRGNPTGPGVTRDQLKTMSAAEIASLDPAEVDRALASS